MATRSSICRQNIDGSYDVVYCHNDGYPSHVGRVLYTHYRSRKKIAALLALGDLPTLGPEIGEKHPFDQREYNRCTAYGRDRGEHNTEARHFPDYDALSAMLEESWTEWVYIYRAGDRKWHYTNNPSRTWFKCCGEQRQTEYLTPKAWKQDSL